MTAGVEVPGGVSTSGDRLARAIERIRDAERLSGRPVGSVTLVAVTKFHDVDTIEPAIAGGQRVFGESRVQEASRKWATVNLRVPGTELHLIGRLQSNKARQATQLFDVIHTIDRPELAQAVGRAMAYVGRRPRCLVQVNTGREPQKGGVFPEAADAFVAECVEEHGLEIAGLMCIPPDGLDPERHFALLGEIASRNQLELLSMGMSNDFELAIRHGATHVRIGRAIFGDRPIR